MAATEQKEACFEMGPETHAIPMTLFSNNRQRLAARLRAMSACPPNAVVVLRGGTGEMHNDTDHEEMFRQESYFHWAFGALEPDCMGAIDVATGEGVLFIPRLPAEYATWMGKIQPPEHFKSRYAVDKCGFTDEMPAFLNDLAENAVLLTMNGLNTDSGAYSIETEFEGMDQYTVNKALLHAEITELRVFKTPEEIEVLRYANRISSAAHKEVMKQITPGRKEYQMEAVFHHHCHFVGGCRHVSYTCICGSGLNGATLHYGHAGAPNDKTINDGDMCLFDMGGEYFRYASDITCSYPANGKFTDFQKVVYNAVLKSGVDVMAAMKPGVSWPAMHLLSDRVHCEELLRAGVLKGTVEDLMANNIGALFQPHGLGHFMGIDTHDVGGYPKGVERATQAGLKSLRCGRVLEAGMCITVEPGIYFIPAILEPACDDPAKAQFLNVELIKANLGFGGVRIEDNVILTEDGIELLTDVPRTVEEIEAFMAK